MDRADMTHPLTPREKVAAYNEARRVINPKNPKISAIQRIRSRNQNTAIKDPAQRFLQYVEQDPNGGCWLWSGAMSGNGYGVFTKGGQNVPAHRFSVETFIGSIGESHVLHACDVRLCVNPAHLSLGSMSDNMRDAASKGRLRRSNKRFEKIPRSLMSEAIRRVQGGESKRSVARSLDIPDSSIRRAMKGMTNV
jgi:HNH endonuclease/CENP-B N-terminal DNA-binding domain